MTHKKSIFAMLPVIVLILSLAFVFTACSSNQSNAPTDSAKPEAEEVILDENNLDNFPIDSYDAEYVVLGIEGNDITLAPSNYDGDSAEDFKDQISTGKIASDLKCADFSLYTEEKSDGEKNTVVSSKPLKLSDIREMLSDGNSPYVRVWLNKDKEIYIMALYGETIVQI